MTLTRAEILAMPADELRVEIAKRRGFDVVHIPSPNTGYVWFQLHKVTGRYSASSYLSEAKAWQDTPDPTVNIADTWVLWNELPNFKAIEEYAPRENMETKFVYLRTDTLHVRISGEPILLAISRAWLLWDVTREGAG